MSVKIRLMRVGKTKQPAYRVVVADSRSPRDGRFIEIIGQYGPREEPLRIQIEGEKALAWLRKGAQPTEQVQKLLAVTGVWQQFESEKGGRVDTKLARRRLGDPKMVAKKAKQQAGAACDDKPDSAATGEPAPEVPTEDQTESKEESSE